MIVQIEFPALKAWILASCTGTSLNTSSFCIMAKRVPTIAQSAAWQGFRVLGTKVEGLGSRV